MIPLAALDCLDRLLRDLCRDDKPFGGKILLLGGDFRQILPVLPHAEPAEVVANTILHHYTMRDGTFQKFSLTENMRLSRDARDSATHRDWLLRLGEGSLDGLPDLQAPSISLPSQLCMPDGQPLEALIDWTYPDVRGNADATASGVDVETADAWFRERAILTPRNDEARQANDLILERLDPATETLSLGHDSIKDPEGEDAASFPEEFLHTLQPGGFPPHALRLRRGAVVMILRNLDKTRGLCNGVRAVVLRASARILDVRVLSGPAAGDRVFLPRIPFLSNAGEFPFVLRRRQFPVALAWAMTMHKAQGQSLARCGVLLERPVFTHGQLYVSASRATSAGGLRFWLGESEGHGHRDEDGNPYDEPRTHNVVFKSVLQLSSASGSNDTRNITAQAARPLRATDVPSELAPRARSASTDSASTEESSNEYRDLSSTAQTSLHNRLLGKGSADFAAAELGATGDPDMQPPARPLDFDDSCGDDGADDTDQALLRAQEDRARSLGVLPSVWWEVAQRPAADRALFLEIEAAPASSGGAASSSSAGAPH